MHLCISTPAPRLALNYQVYKICIDEGELPTSEDFKLDYKLKFMWMFKISNLFNYIVRIGKPLKVVFQDFEASSMRLVKEVALLVLHDVIGKNSLSPSPRTFNFST